VQLLLGALGTFFIAALCDAGERRFLQLYFTCSILLVLDACVILNPE
jgi:hypothetical protein